MSSATDTARADIESAVSLAWAGQTSIQYADRPFTVPASGSWLRLTVLFGDGFPFTMGPAGAGQNRIVGVVDAAVFAKEGDGLGAAVQLADDVRNAFNQQIKGTVRFGVCSGPASVEDVDGYAHLVVTCPFEILETV